MKSNDIDAIAQLQKLKFPTGYFIDNNVGKRLVVLNGYFHRYYLYALLKVKENSNGFVIKEFYDY